MENYIVRIYKRVDSNPNFISGIVENQESGENIPFHSADDFIDIFLGSQAVPKSPAKQDVVEKRKYRRFNVRNSNLVFENATDIGKIKDISLGGLSFYCPTMPEYSGERFKIGILCQGVKDFCTGKINCRNLKLRNTPGDSGPLEIESGKSFSIEFDKLNKNLKAQLEYIIRNYAVYEE